MPLEHLIEKRWAIVVALLVVLLLTPTAWPVHGLVAFVISVALRLAIIVILGYHLGRIFRRYGWRGPRVQQ